MRIKLKSTILLFFASTACLFVLDSCSTPKETVEKISPAVNVEKAEMSSPTLSTAERYSAVVAPSVQMDVSFKGTGYIESLYQVRGSNGRNRTVQDGDFVRRGTILAKIRQADGLSKINEQAAAVKEVVQSGSRIQANISAAQADRQQAQLEFDRASRLFEQNSLTKPEFDSAKTRLEISEARLREAQAQVAVSGATAERARAGLNEARLALQDCILKAPMDGIVLKRNVESGSYVSAGTVGFVLADANSVKVEFGVADIRLKGLQSGQQLKITTEAVPGKVFHGQITEIAAAADPKSRVFNIQVTVPNPDHQLHPGMVASLSISDNKPSTALLTVPMSAIVRSSADPQGYAVFVAQEKGGKFIAQERPVRLGEAIGHLITVTDGVKTGEAVVTNGSSRIASGQEIRILN